MASPPYELKVVEQSQVFPQPGSSSSSTQLPPLPLTFFDIIWLYYSPVERFFLFDFPHPTSHFINSILPDLKSSLSLTLHHFYPLAGRVRLAPNSDHQFQLSYLDGDSVRLTVAETNADFSDLAGVHPRDYTSIHHLIPQLSESDIGRPLLAIQVTVFPNHGISIGLAIHHVACDGVTVMHFIKSWAAACRSGVSTPSAAPIYNRALIADPSGLYSALLRELLDLESKTKKAVVSSGFTAYTDLVSATFTLDSSQVQRLKKLVQDKAERVRCSTFVVTCAHVWVCQVKLRGWASDRPAHFTFAVDWRGRLPIPAAYFGNCMGPCFVEANAGDLTGEDGIVVASEAIGKAIEELKDGIFKTMDGFVERFLAVVPYGPLSVAGSPRFGVYETDFGWGRPKKVEVPSIQKSGAISLSDSRGGGGGVEIGLVLEKHEMEEFTAHFTRGLDDLLSR